MMEGIGGAIGEGKLGVGGEMAGACGRLNSTGGNGIQ